MVVARPDLAALPEGQAGIAQLRAYVLQPASDAAASSAAEAADVLKHQEACIGALADALVKAQDAQGLADLLTQLRGFFNTVPKAKTAKIVRSIIDAIARIPNSTDLQVRCRSCNGSDVVMHCLHNRQHYSRT
jgi:hypothetical protein